MEVYKAETREILRRFLARELSHKDCTGLLNTALMDIIPHLDPSDLPALQKIVSETNRAVSDEMSRRELRPSSPSGP
jgi:hypothetical protein